MSDIKNAENYSLSASSWKFLADVKSMSNYFPYGMKIDAGSWSPSKYHFAYNGKQEESFDKNFLHYGARSHDSKNGQFISPDPLEKNYPSNSAYAYVANNPVNAIDPNGEAVLFINGLHAGSGGRVSYWKGFDRKINRLFNDYNSHYIDGAIGGWDSGLLYSGNIFIQDRYDSGKEWAMKYGETFIKSLGDKETIKIVTHSMGAATSRGVIDGLNKIAKDLNVEIEFEILLDVEAFQGEELKIPTLDGKVIFDEGQHFSKIGGKSLLWLFVDKTPNSTDASSENESENANHYIIDFDTENLPELDSKTSGGNYQQTEYGPYNKEKSEKIKSK